MSRAARDLHKRKFGKHLATLERMLSCCDDDAFLQLTWAVNMLQSGFDIDVRRYLRYPPEAATNQRDSPYAASKWDLETLLTLLFTTPKCATNNGASGSYRCDLFDTIAMVVNQLRDAEDHEAGVFVNDDNVLMELHRAGHRQLEWQRGFATSERLYRYIFVYAQGACDDYFKKTHGLSIQEFVQVGLLLNKQLHLQPWAHTVGVEQLGIDVPLIEKSLPLISRTLNDIRIEAKDLVDQANRSDGTPIAYRPSALRRFPIITFPQHGKYISPLPQLIVLRVTAGLYYDIRNGPQSLIADANNRFEKYARDVLKGYFPRFNVLPSQKYGPKKNRYDSPDILIQDRGQIVAVVECKATKLTHKAQFGENPIVEANQAYVQVVKGIKQIWKFFSHVRGKLFDEVPVNKNAYGVLLTMDAWMQMSAKLQCDAIALAKEELSGNPDITETDMRPIIFCPMQELADTMSISDEDQFLTALDSASKDEFTGWSLSDVCRKTNDSGEPCKFPLDMGSLMPWWDQLRRKERTP